MTETKSEIVEFNEFENKLKEFKDQYDDVVYNLNDPVQNKQARTDKHSIGKILAKLDKAHQAIKAPLKEKVDLIDGERKRIKDQLLEVQGKIKGQIEKHEQDIADKAEELQERVDHIRSLNIFVPGECINTAHVKSRLADAEAIVIDDTFEDRKADATLAHVETVKALKDKLEEMIRYDNEQAELEKLRKEKADRELKDREADIRKEAEEKARKEEQEKAEEEKLKAKDKAEKEKKEAAEAAQKEIDDAKRMQEEAEAEKERVKKEAAQAVGNAARREREKIEEEQMERDVAEKLKTEKEEREKSKKAHRDKIEREIVQSLVANSADKADFKELIKMIADGKIKHVSIKY